MTQETIIIELFDDGQIIYDWSHWKRNYIANMNNIHQGKNNQDAKGFYESAVYYIREADSAVLSPALKIHDVCLEHEHDEEPGDMRTVTFKGHLSRVNPLTYPGFRYSPSGGYEVPAAFMLTQPLTLDELEVYKQYYTEGPGWASFRKADFDGYRLHDKSQTHYPPELKDAWAITRPAPGTHGDTMANREVLMCDGSWLPVESRAVHFSFVNEFPKFTYKFKKAIELIREFTS